MSKTASIIITLGLVISIGVIFLGQTEENSAATGTLSSGNVEIRDGVQYVTINAKGGYSPKLSTAQADIPTKLIVKTNGTYDCSLALVIKSIGYKKVLPQTGEEVIDLGNPEAGMFQGLCSMGMYKFAVDFK